MKFLIVAALLAVGPISADPCVAAGTCCKICTKGKACGDTCIAANKKCHQPKGCACDAH